MARKKRRFKRSFRFGKWYGLAFKIAGAAVTAGPMINAVVQQRSNPTNIPAAIMYGYTGFDPSNPGGGLNGGQLTVGAASIIGGIVLVKIGSMLARSV